MTTTSEFAVIEHAAQQTAVIRARVPVAELPRFFSQGLPRVLAAIDAQQLVPSGEPFAYYHGMPDGTVDVETGFPVNGLFASAGDVVTGELPHSRVVTGVHHGPYETLANTYEQMTAWAVARGLTPAAGMWEVYLTDPEQEPDPSRWETRIFLKVE